MNAHGQQPLGRPRDPDLFEQRADPGPEGRQLRDLRIDPGMRDQPLHEPRRRQPVDVAIPDLQPGPDGVTKAMQLGGVAERDPPQPTREQFVGLRAGTPKATDAGPTSQSGGSEAALRRTSSRCRRTDGLTWFSERSSGRSMRSFSERMAK
jgi:hypothetical protein